MSKGIFITATGTDIGKTYVTGLILKLLRENNINASYYKAALSGADLVNDKLIPGDAKYVANISNLKEDPTNLVSYIYKTAVSPHLASEIEGNPIEMNKIKSDFLKAKSNCDYITVEGSGGIICPLRMDNQLIMLKDVIKELNLDIFIIASSELGTINNVVLTVDYAKSNNINVRGIIMNNYDENNFLHRDNKKSVERLTGIPVIATVKTNDKNLDIDINKLLNLYQEI